MPLGQIRVDPADFPEVEMPCLRCGARRDALRGSRARRARTRCGRRCDGDAQTVDAEYVPKMNVTPNAVALKD